MPRAFLLVMDSVGAGGAPDAAAFGDEGANTLGHIAAACAAGRAEEGRSGPLHLPNFAALGLWEAVGLASGVPVPAGPAPTGLWGAAEEVSKGKDTPSGHWELAGVPVPWDWHYFPRTEPAFPPALTEALIAQAGLPGILGNCHASGMPILRALGEEHIATGKPICYTSADSVFQIAAHEEVFGLERLMQVCEVAATLVHPMRVGRVIARPFLGRSPEEFRRTANRRDLAIPPPEPTLCERVVAAGGRTIGIGKIGDIFAHRGISELLKGADDMALVDHTIEMARTAPDGTFVFANYVEFDSLYGHPRDVAGYARTLEAFDARLPAITAHLREGDLMIITADHGNDPTWPGTEHTRERVPVLGAGPGLSGPVGLVRFADVGESIATHLGLAPGAHGRSFL
ncbi:phosphopentomutase (plasmid) [Paroceanicella profunda]|uniref:Phosphopentomutase n=1 Tax=Paroceanicella profunda TaxID=2579971 RepID=A0A5B8FJC7_9RHOB|nr:phosphopentomutase [Paroceanicella profunda]QDL94148.1 phosphopentomutase [Paroceanicella profunda]